MTSRLLLLQIILFGVALTLAKAGGDLREQSNLDPAGPASAEDNAKEQEYEFKSDELTGIRNSEASQTEEAMNTTLSFNKVTDGTSKTTNDPNLELSSTQVFITTPNENSTQASSANTREVISDTASTMPSTKHDSADEVSVTTMRSSTFSENDKLLDATTKVSDSEPSTSDILITATTDITQRELTVSPRKYISGSTSAMSSQSTSTPAEQSSTMMEGVTATMVLPSDATEKVELLEVTTEASELTESTSQDDFTQPSEKSTSNSVTTMRRDVSETVSTMPSTSTIIQGSKEALTNEFTTVTMLSSTAREMDQNLNATTEVSDLERSTSQVVFSSTEGNTQADPITTMRRDVSEFSTSVQTTTSATGEIETEDAASKASTFTKRALSTTTPNEVSSASTTKRTFLENDDPITNASTTSLSTAETTPTSIRASLSTMSSTSTGASPVPTILPSTETDRSHSTFPSSSSTIFPESTSKKIPSTTTSVRPTTAEPQTCVDAKRIGNSRINCSIYRRKCHIKSYKNMLKKYCPVTCGYCKLCVDQIRNRRNICTQNIQSTLRKCNHKRPNFRAYTRKRCPVTCGVCSEGSVLLLR